MRHRKKVSSGMNGYKIFPELVNGLVHKIINEWMDGPSECVDGRVRGCSSPARVVVTSFSEKGRSCRHATLARLIKPTEERGRGGGVKGGGEWEKGGGERGRGCGRLGRGKLRI